MGETRKLAAILVADIVGYSRLAGVDEDRTCASPDLRSDLIAPPSPPITHASSSAPAMAQLSSSGVSSTR